MWTVVAEQPLLLAVMAGISAAGLVAAWLQSGDKRFAFGAGLLALLIPGAYLIADAITTDREMILEAVYQTAEAVEKNDIETAVLVIEDRQTRQRALSELPRFDFQRVRVRNIKLEMIQGSLPPEATVDLDASVTASLASGTVRDQRIPRRLIVTFQKQPDGQWMVTDYRHLSLTGQADGFSSLGI